MTFLPIVDRELRVAARRPVTYWTRLLFAIAGAGIVSLALLFAAAAQTGASGIGGWLFYFLSLLALGFSAFAGVFLTADCLSEEKREGTLGLLFLTDLKGYDVVFGKLLARSLTAAYGLLAIFPVLAITLTMGGVTAGEFWRRGAGLVSVTGGESAVVSDTALWRRATRRRLLLDRNPVYWLTTRNSRTSRASWVVWAGLVVGFAWFSCRNPTIAVAAGQNGWPILLGVLRIFVGMYACRFF